MAGAGPARAGGRMAADLDGPRKGSADDRCLRARSGWELHAIATFAGHRHIDSTLAYIHLSGRDLAAKLATGMAALHARRVALLAEADDADDG